MKPGVRRNSTGVVFILAVCIVISIAAPAFADVTFAAVGDVLLDRGVRSTIERHGAEFIFKRVKSIIAKHDLAFFNLESPLTPADVGYPLLKTFSFRGDPDYAKFIVNAGFTLASVANNHTIDWDRRGFVETLRVLRAHQIHAVGGGLDQRQALRPVIIHKNGLTFAFFGAVSFLLEGLAFVESGAAPAYAGIEELNRQIRAYRNAVDFIIVSFHWGLESHPYPTSRQVDYAHAVIDAGADLVLGHHPHVLQTIERYKKRMIFYSLGNFVFDNSRPEQKQSVILSCRFIEERMIELQLYPVTIRQHRPTLATETESRKILARLIKLSTDFGVQLQRTNGRIRVTAQADHAPYTVPLRQWNIGSKRIEVYPAKIDLFDLETAQKKTLPIRNKSRYIRDASIVDDKEVARIYAIVGPLAQSRGQHIVVFPIDLKRFDFSAPNIDLHLLNPWKIRTGDVDGDKNPEVIVGVWKKTRYSRKEANRLFVYNRRHNTIYPKWLGSRLGPAFVDFELCDFDNDGTTEVITYTSAPTEPESQNAFKWNGFGFRKISSFVANAPDSGAARE